MPGITFKRTLLSLFLLITLPLFACAQESLININTAGVAELDTLPGIGPAYAQRIVDYRTASGPFQNIEEIQNVSGIGPSTFADIRSLITVGGVQTGSAPIHQESSQVKQDGSGSSSLASPVRVDKKSPLTVSAGKDRVEVVGSPVEFKAETNSKIDGRRGAFRWNFGEGSESEGESVTHLYDYPGEYVVVVSVDSGEEEVSARVNVKIVDPGIAVSLATPERIELKNNSKYEANLFGRALIVGGKAFVFPRNTIIKAGQGISFGSRVTGLSPYSIDNVQIMVLGETENPKIIAKIEKQKTEKIASLEKQISILQQKMLDVPSLATQPGLPTNKAQKIESVVEKEPPESLIDEIVPQTAAAKEGWFGVLKRFFLRVK